MEREKILLSEKDLYEFDITKKRGTWELFGETYVYIDNIRTDAQSDGPSWDTIVKRESDGKFFKWNCWDAGDYNGYLMESGNNFMTETFPRDIITTVYE